MKYTITFDKLVGEYWVVQGDKIMATGMNKSTAEWIANAFNVMLEGYGG